MKNKLEGMPGGEKIEISIEEQKQIFLEKIKEFSRAEKILRAEADGLDPKTKEQIVPALEEIEKRTQEVQGSIEEQIAA